MNNGIKNLNTMEGKKEGGMTLEQTIKESIQSKSHKFSIGRTHLKISFSKDETGTIKDVLIVELGAESGVSNNENIS